MKLETDYFQIILDRYLDEIDKEGLILPECVKRTGAPLELEFYPTDSKSNWLEIAKLKRFSTTIHRYPRTFKTSDVKELVNYYTDNPITYKLNSYGFRDTQLDTKENKDITVFLGCSFTFGTGLHEDKIWTHHVKRHFNLKNTINGATPGTGPLTHLRTLLYLIQNFDVQRVFYLYDFHNTRYEWDLGNLQAEYETFMFGEDPRFTQKIMKALVSPRNAKLFDILCFSAIQKICDFYQLEFVYQPITTYTDIDYNSDKYKMVDKWARDLMHTGFVSQRIMASNFIKKYNNLVGAPNNSDYI